jgi:hypothetical protein
MTIANRDSSPAFIARILHGADFSVSMQELPAQISTTPEKRRHRVTCVGPALAILKAN